MGGDKSGKFRLASIWHFTFAYAAVVLAVSVSKGEFSDRLLWSAMFMLLGSVAIQLATTFDRYRLGAFLSCLGLLGYAFFIRDDFSIVWLFFLAMARHSLWPAPPAVSSVALPEFEENSLPWAVSRGDWNLAKHLIVAQLVDPNVIVCGYSPLGIARFRKDQAMMLMLKRCGAVVDVGLDGPDI